jgi:hypothetical protein
MSKTTTRTKRKITKALGELRTIITSETENRCSRSSRMNEVKNCFFCRKNKRKRFKIVEKTMNGINSSTS